MIDSTWGDIEDFWTRNGYIYNSTRNDGWYTYPVKLRQAIDGEWMWFDTENTTLPFSKKPKEDSCSFKGIEEII